MSRMRVASKNQNGNTKQRSQINDVVKDNNFNDTSVTSWTTKYRLLEDNWKLVEQEIVRQKSGFADFGDEQKNIREWIELKGDQLRDNVEASIQKMDDKIQNSWSHQKAENSRLIQQITQLKADEIGVKNQWNALQKRIEDIGLQIGFDVGYGH